METLYLRPSTVLKVPRDQAIGGGVAAYMIKEWQLPRTIPPNLSLLFQVNMSLNVQRERVLESTKG